MLQFFTVRNPVILGILLVFIIFLRFPSFNSEYIGNIESSHLIIADRILSGGIHYLDAWDCKPPLTTWFYTFFRWGFGDYALGAINIFAIIYIFISSVLLDGLISNYRSPNESSSFSAFLFAFLISAPCFSQEVGPEFLSILPMLLTLAYFSTYVMEEQKKWDYLFYMGVLIGICTGLKHQGFIFLITIMIAYVFTTRPSLKDMVTGGGGFIITLLIIYLPIYFLGAFSSYWDLAVLYNYDHYKFDIFNGAITDSYSLFDFLRYYGVFFLLALFGFLSYRGRRAGSIVKHRKFEVIMSIFLAVGAGIIALSGKFFFMPYVYFVAPAMVFYITSYLNGKNFKRFKRFVLFTAYLMPVYSYLIYVICANTALYQWVEPFEKYDYWIHQFRRNLVPDKQIELFKKDLLNHKINTGIWVAYYQPDLYIRLDKKCASKYVDFAIAYNKMDWLSHNFKHSTLLSKSESMANVYHAFRYEKPDYIIDAYGIFQEIKNHLPLLMDDYSMKKIGYCKVYYRGNAIPSPKIESNHH